MQNLAKSIIASPGPRRGKRYPVERPGHPSRSALLPTSGRVLFTELIHRLSVALCIAAFAWMGTSYTAAQSASTGAIAGTVLDPSGAVIPRVSVSVRSNGTDQPRTTMTDDSGEYRLSFLQPGLYDLTALVAPNRCMIARHRGHGWLSPLSREFEQASSLVHRGEISRAVIAAASHVGSKPVGLRGADSELGNWG